MATEIKTTQKVAYIRPEYKQCLSDIESNFKNFSLFLIAVMMLSIEDSKFKSKVESKYKELGGK